MNTVDGLSVPAAALQPRRPYTSGAPRHLLITLLGDYWYMRPEVLPSAALVDLLAEFGTHETAARQAMRRLVAAGQLRQERHGRTTAYGIPEHILAGQRGRVRRAIRFGQEYDDWDGEWTLVAFTVPEADRGSRRQLRTELRALKFGMLQDGLWLSPYDLVDEASEVLERLSVDRGHVLRGRWPEQEQLQAVLADAFDLPAVAAAYADFSDRYAHVLLESPARSSDDTEALLLRTRITNEWMALGSLDPELPVELLASDWPGTRAKVLFTAVYDLLAPAATARFRHIVGRHDPDIAGLAISHRSWEEGEASHS